MVATESDAANEAYYSKLATDFDLKYTQTLGQLEAELKESKDFIGVNPAWRMLDYACGTGLLSRALGPDLAECVGIDISNGMCDYYNDKARRDGLYPAREAFRGNILQPSTPNPEAFVDPKFSGFDIAGVGTGFHFFDDRDLAAVRLAERLRPGGVFFIVDFLPNENDRVTLAHRERMSDFSQETMREIFEGAGVGGDFAFKEMQADVVFHETLTRKAFLARGTKLGRLC